MRQNNRVWMTQTFVQTSFGVLTITQAKDKLLGIEKCSGNSLPTLGPSRVSSPTLDPTQDNHHERNGHHSFFSTN